jgi:hypothetical protein
LTPLTPDEVRHATEEGHFTPWDTSLSDHTSLYSEYLERMT